MKERIIRFLGRLTPFFVLLILLYPQLTGAQTKYLLPLGNSITWGKSDRSAPPPGQHGYRDHLYDEIHNYGTYTIDFVGGIDDGNYDGWYFDGAHVNEFLADSSSREVIAMIDGLPIKPDYVTLHLGTNDIGTIQTVGSYLTDGTVARELWILLQELLDYHRTNPADSIEQIFLCKIIPAAPYAEWSGYNSKILDYNSKIQEMYENLGDDQARVTLVDMHSPFYANQSTYYTADTDPGTDDDNFHPSQYGYEQMAGYFGDNIKDYLSQYLVEFDEFDRAPALMALDASNNWTAAGAIKIEDVGESGGGAIYSESTTGDWDNREIAIWGTTLGMNSISMEIHDNSSQNSDTLSGVGLLVGMNSIDVNNTSGYLVFVRNGMARVYVIDGSEINREVASGAFPSWTRGDVFKVTYVITQDGRNVFYLSLNGGNESALTADMYVPLLERGIDYYSGVMFRGNTANRLLIDSYRSENQFRDVIPPAQITLFTLSGATTNNSVTLQWWAVGDDGNEQGTGASSYDLRYSTHPINESNFDDAHIIAGVPPPQVSGTQEFFTVGALMAGARYYFSIKAVDRYGNPSPIADDIEVRTTSEGQIPDEFDRAELGNQWVYDDSEYAINTNTDELVNLLDDGDFGTMAIYKGLVNLSTVKMVWGNNVGLPTFGDGTSDNGGFVFLVDDSSLTADGYFLFVRTTLNLIYLFDIENGEISPEYLDAVAYNLEGLGRKVGAMDTLAVVMDVSEEDEAPNKFNVYVHFHDGDRWEPASRFSLYDSRPVSDPFDQRHGLTDRNYSGVILARLNGTRNNNLAAFIPVGEETAPSGIVAAGPTDLGEGVVDTWLQDSSAVCVVQVQNENSLPVQGIPVFFQVTEGGGEVSVPYASDGNIRIEAEWGNPQSPLLIFDDEPDASGGEYIKSIQPAYIAHGSATYRFYIESPGVYYFWGRVKNVQYWDHWLLGFEIVGISPEGGIRWEVLRNELTQGQITGDWQWDAVQEETRNYAYSVEFVQEGLYTLKVWNHHADVYLDKIIVTNQTDFMPVGQETIPTLYSDGNGEAATAWRIGTTADDPTTAAVNEGLNRVVARTFASGETVSFTAYAVASEPDSIVKLTDNLSGASGDTLDLGAVFYDEFGNRASGKAVKFEVIDGDAWWVTTLEPIVTETTDIFGQALPQIVLGVDSASTVRVYFDGYDGPEITISLSVAPGLVATIENLTPPDQKFYVETLYPNFIKVKVKNAVGNPVPNIPVRFEVVEGEQFTTALLGIQPVWSNEAGEAIADLTTGALAGILRVKARTSGMEETIVNDSVFYRVTAIGHQDGGDELLGFGERSINPLRVWCSADGVPAENIPVTYRITDSDLGFTFHNGSQIYVDTTGSSGGLEGITNNVFIKAGNVHGSHKNIVEASASDGFNSVPSMDGGELAAAVYFDFNVKSEAFAFEKQPYDSVGVVRDNIGTLSVKLVKLNGAPVGEQLITFKRILGNGSFDLETALDKRVVKGDEEGFAAVFFWLGDEAGVNNNQVMAYTVNVDDTISTIFSFSANSSEADSLSAISPIAFTDTVGNANTIEVRLQDIGGNKVADQEVFFTVTHGNGYLNGTQNDSLMRITDEEGIASVIWALGDSAGVNTNVLEITSTVDGENPLKGAPLQFTASTIPDRVNGNLSTISATSPVQSVIDDTCKIEVTLRDGFSNLIPDKLVKIVVQGPGPNFFNQNPPASSALGKVYSYLLSETPGEKRIRAIVDGDTLANDTTVVFMANDAARLQEYSGNNQIGNVNTVLKYPFVVEISDDNGYTPNGSVEVNFTVIGGMGEILEPQPVMSDADGFARATLKLDPTAGVHSVQATSAGLQGTATFWATGKVGTSAYMFYGDDYTQAEGEAGEILPKPFIVKVVDTDSLPVAGEAVTFVLNPTEGSNGAIIEPQPVQTNELGLAQIHFRTDTRAGFESWVYTEKPPLTTNKIWFRATSTAGTARKIVAVSSTEQDVHVGDDITLQVRVTDAHDNEKNGVPVEFEVVEGDAVVIQGALTQTDANGIASATILLGTQVGAVTVWATPESTMLEGSPVEFTINAVTRNQDAADIIRFPVSEDTVYGTVNEYLVDSLNVRVIDVYGNPVSGQTVIFSLIGQGSIDGDGRETSDGNGISAIAYKCGTNSDGISTVRAEWGSNPIKTVTFTIKAVTNPYSPVFDQNYFANSYNIKEDEYPPLKIKMVAEDEDNDDLTFGVADLFYPDEIMVYPETNSDSSAIFEWTPTFDRGRNEPYFITLQVTDGRGGSDEKTVRIFVQDISQLPYIVEKYPEERKVSVTAGSTVAFWVVAENADNDPMQYSWRVDKQPAGSDNPVYYHHVDENFTGKQLVDILVMDEYGAADPTNGWFEWELNVSTAVEMTEFIAQFDVQSSSVQLRWSTSHETDNCGFDVYRSHHEENGYTKINENLIPSNEKGKYSYTDRTIDVGIPYYYKLVSIDISGNEKEYGPVMVKIPRPEKLELSQNYPNPFNPVTTIQYTVPAREHVTLSIYNMLGQRVVMLVDEEKNPGYYAAEWDGKDSRGLDVATGIYLYRLTGKRHSAMRKMIKLR